MAFLFNICFEIINDLFVKQNKLGASKSSKKGGISSGAGGGGAVTTKSSLKSGSRKSVKKDRQKGGAGASGSIESATLEAVESWLEEQRAKHPLEEPKASEVREWDAKRLSQFMLSVPFYQFNVKYSEMIVSKGITGEQFLKASPAQMKLWGIKSIAHCGRLRAEINQMRKRG